jgi:hypothetical protein
MSQVTIKYWQPYLLLCLHSSINMQ